jgi:hypothetical protein
MKIEVFILPKDGEVRLAPSPSPGAPARVDGKVPVGAQPPSIQRIPWKLMALSLLLAGILAVCGIAGYSTYQAISAMDQLSVQHNSGVTQQKSSVKSVGPKEDGSRVQHFDNSHPLRRGDVVVMRENHGANVGQVAVTANSTGVFKRGSAVEALYVLGEDRYLVRSEGGTRIVHGNEILATVASSPERQ